MDGLSVIDANWCLSDYSSSSQVESHPILDILNIRKGDMSSP